VLQAETRQVFASEPPSLPTGHRRGHSLACAGEAVPGPADGQQHREGQQQHHRSRRRTAAHRARLRRPRRAVCPLSAAPMSQNRRFRGLCHRVGLRGGVRAGAGRDPRLPSAVAAPYGSDGRMRSRAAECAARLWERQQHAFQPPARRQTAAPKALEASRAPGAALQPTSLRFRILSRRRCPKPA